jgi:DedD protein
MAKQATEEEFNLVRQTRRRLIGAVALVLLAVILLPTVFDNQPAPSSGNNIELRIPNKDSAGEFQPKINLPELDKMASEVSAASSANAAAPAAAPVPPVAKQPVVAPVVSKSAAEIQPKPEARPVPENKPGTAKPKPEAKSKPAVKPPAVPKTGWAVQVGAFANAGTARSLQAKLGKQGYHAYTEKTGSVVRVRVGSYPTQHAAEKVKGKLEAHGMHANVVNLEQGR